MILLPIALAAIATALLFASFGGSGWKFGERLSWSLAWGPAFAFGIPSLAFFAARACGMGGTVSWLFVAAVLIAGLRAIVRVQSANLPRRWPDGQPGPAGERGAAEPVNPTPVIPTPVIPTHDSPRTRARGGPGWRALVVLLLLVTGAQMVQNLMTWRRAQPDGMWDAVAIWNNSAHFLYRAAPEKLPALIGAGTQGHSEYPLFLGGAIAAQFSLVGREVSTIPLGMDWAFLVGLAAALYLLVRIAGAPVFAGPAVLLVLSTPVVWKWAFAQVADLPLAYLALAAALPLVSLLEAPEAPGPPPVLAGVVLGLLPWMKDEGVMILGILILLFTGLSLRRDRAGAWRRPSWSRGVGMGMLAGALPGLLAVVIFKVGWAPSSGAFDRPLATLLDVERWRIVAGLVLPLFDPRVGASLFGLAWPFLALGLCLWGASLMRPGAPGAKLLLGTAALGFAGYCCAFMLTAADLRWQVEASLDRLLLQLLPLAAAGVFSLAGSESGSRGGVRKAARGSAHPFGAAPPEIPVERSAQPTSVKLSVVVPVFNERYLVRELLQRVLEVSDPSLRELEIVVVDDGSTDGTREILHELAAAEPRLRYFEQPANRGKGSAIRAGIAAATGDLILFQDADLEYDPRDYVRLVRPFLEDGADVVYGSRFLAGDRRRVLQFRHARINRILTWLSNLLTDLDLTDMETCYKVFRAELLKSIPLRSDDFGLEPEITAKIAKRGFRIFEVPISYLGRTQREGKKIGWTDGFRALATMIRFWIIDDVYAPDEYGSHILTSLEKAKNFNSWMADEVRPDIGDRVLEIGAGIGNMTTWLLPRDIWVASDINPNYLHYLKNFAAGKPYLAVRRMDVESAEEFASWKERFDTVLCLNVLEHVGDPLLALRNMRSALVSGGHLVLYVPQGAKLYSSLDSVLGHRCRYDLAMLQREFAATGFELVEWRYFNRAAVAGWWWNGKVLKRRTFSRIQLKLFDLVVPLLRRVDRFLPWPGLGLMAIARRVDAPPPGSTRA
ncbi:MAG: bifunctional glycosyltransferase/class I SAM-dependent methyltransferase [Thermoanaerobaculia bacterium]